ncbi:MAG: gamma-glutamylcyclotransferase family protein [Deltaproteobacteria bacterium]|nr:gamma-glutamylcyclotransferase family protein [Deltaproteobacteria bacterium]
MLYQQTVSHVWYFAYGSNMQTATLCGRRRVAYRRAVPVRVPGWRLVLDKPPLISLAHSFANIVREDGAEVLGVCYELTSEDHEHVELTEGVRIGNYASVEVQARLLAEPDAAPLQARSLSSAKRDDRLRPSTRYMQLLIEGALEHGLPDDYIAALRAIPAEPEKAAARAARGMIDAAMRLARPRP